jgi:L-threonylcarbamoyladenylate synthase
LQTPERIDARTEPLERVIEAVASVVLRGGVVIFPTETVYGIGCDPFDLDAIARIYGAKHRPAHKPLSLHLATVGEFLEYVRDQREVSAAARRLLPGPVTIIMRRPSFIDREMSAGLPTLGFRVPDDVLCAAILDRCGPLAATSANLSGERPYFGTGDSSALPPADLIVENGPTKYQRESSVVDFSGPQPVLLREGVVPYERLSELVGPLVRYRVAT